jgi:hypothetical protein
MENYVYKQISAPNSVRLKAGANNIKSLIITNTTDSEIVISIYLSKTYEKYHISKSLRIIANESLNVFQQGYSFDPNYTLNITLESGSADVLLILDQ